MTLLRQIECYLRDSGMPPTRFGRAAANDPRLVLDLRNGREPGLRLTQRVEAYIKASRP